MKRVKKIFSAVIAVFILLNIFPQAAFAGEEASGGTPTITDSKKHMETMEIFFRQKKQKDHEEKDPPVSSDIPDKQEDEPQKDYDKLLAEEFIKAVERIGYITLDDETAVCDAIRFYESLSDLAKDMVKDAKKRLDEAMSIIKYLKGEEEKLLKSEEKFTQLSEKLEYIASLTKEAGHEALLNEIILLEEIYATFTEEEKLVYDERLLMEETPAFEDTLAAIKDRFISWQKEYDEPFVNAAKEKLALISQLVFEDGTEILEANITEFVNLYGSLSASQKTLFEQTEGKYDDIISSLDRKLLAWKTAGDIPAVIALLENIRSIEKISPEHSELINSAKDALSLISDKSMIPEELLLSFATACSALGTAVADKEKADEVSSLISALGDISLQSEEAIIAARSAYDLLSDGQKGYVTNYNDLTAKEEEIRILKEEKIKADEIISLIDSLGEITPEKEETIISLRQSYDLLSEKGKNFVTNIAKLSEAESTLADIKAANEISEMIASIGEVGTEKLSLIRDIREKYDALTDRQKTLVTNLPTLEEAEEILKDHIASEKLDKLISKLPESATFKREDSIFAAKKYYDSLTDVQKSLVKDTEKLMRVYDEMISMKKKLEKYIEEHGSSSIYFEDLTGYITVSVTLDDLLTTEDKDLIASGKTILYTITSFSEEFTYEEVNVSFLPTEAEEVVFSPFYYVYISRAVADVDENGVISDDSYCQIKEIPGVMTVELTLSEDLLPETTEITRIFTGLVSPASEAGNFTRIMDTDMNMNTMTFTVNGSVNIIPSFIDIMNPMTGDDATIYFIFGAFAVILAALTVLRKKRS